MRNLLPLILLLAAPALAQSTRAEQPAAAAKPDGKDEKKVCHVEAPTGSMFSKRVCKTAAENETNAQAAREALRQQQTLRPQ